MALKMIFLNNEMKSSSFMMERSIEEEKCCRIKQLAKNCLIEAVSITLLTKAACFYAVCCGFISL